MDQEIQDFQSQNQISSLSGEEGYQVKLEIFEGPLDLLLF
jgi:hypothetical protein